MEKGKSSPGLGQTKDLSTLIAARGQAKSTITKIFLFTNDVASIKRCNSSLIKIRKKHLIEAFEEYKILNSQIIAKESAAGSSSDPEDTFSVYEDKYLTALATMCEVFDEQTPINTQEDSQDKFVHLPKISINTFNGKDEDYYPFISVFVNMIGKDTRLNNTQKLYYLRSFLSNEPLDIIKNLPLNDASYQISLDLLAQRYDNLNKIVTTHINSLLELNQIIKCTASNLRSFIATVKQCLSALQSLSQPIEHWDTIIVCILTKKLDNYTVRSFYEEHADKSKLVSLSDLLNFLENKALALEATNRDKRQAPSNSASTAPRYPTAQRSQTSLAATSSLKCEYCHVASHKLYKCAKFKTSSIKDRIAFIENKRICKVCLNFHSGKCSFKFKCSRCKDPNHNSLLHTDANTNACSNTEQLKTVSLHNNINNNKCVLLPTVLIKLLQRDGTPLYVKAILDTGSEVSMVTQEIANAIDCSISQNPHTVVGVCSASNNVDMIAKFQIYACNSNFSMPIACSVVNKITCTLPHQYVDISHLNIPPNIKLADTSFHAPGEIKMLIGCDGFFQVLLRERIPLTPSGPYLINTQFGYVVGGAIVGSNKHQQYICNFLKLDTKSDTLINKLNSPIVEKQCSCDKSLDYQLQQFWSAEQVPEVLFEGTSEQNLAEKSFTESVSLSENRFTVDLPLKCNIENVDLGDSLSSALSRFYALEKRFKKDNQLFQKYKAFIDEYLKLGHAKIVDISQYEINKTNAYYLGHHPVFNLNSKTSPIRVVFQGIHTSSHLSINDLLLNGPIVQNDLFSILILFRLDKFILICDIQKMFRNILISENHRHLQNILWRESENEPLQCLQLQTVTYGLKSSTYLATRCLLELADRFADQFPLASDILKNNTYVDDINCGANSIQKLIEIKNQLISLLKLGGFELHKWCSNSAQLLREIPASKQQLENIDLSLNDVHIKTLGLQYNVKNDSIEISCPEKSTLDTYTKREVLSFISKFFDPLGLAGPLLVTAKLFLQSLWKLNVEWDQPLPTDLNERWKKFAFSLINMPAIVVPRNLNISNNINIELIGFADASSAAQACCLYLRVVHENNSVSVNLICSKSRINQLNKKFTTPRLELNSTLLLARLSYKVHETLTKKLGSNIEVHLFSDSQIVLAWLKTEPIKLSVFVANRVKEINKLTNTFNWHYVNTKDNPADCLSRGLDPACLKDHILWWSGPAFLLEKDLNFNSVNENISVENLPEIKTTLVCNKASQNVISFDIERYSSLSKIKRILAYILRFYNNCKLPKDKRNNSNYFSASELQTALKTVIKLEQRKLFCSEIADLLNNKTLKGNLAGLNPFLDSEGLLRVGGRLDNSDLPYSQKHPIILPRSCHLTKLIILDAHINLLHAGPRLILSYLSKNYWIIHSMKEIKNVTHKCVVCFKLKAKHATQLMGSLPKSRVSVMRPFEIIGIDFGGPFSIKQSRLKRVLVTKGYIALFVCFATKAVHIELVSDLTTETFLMAFKRFLFRRNLPSKIYCDNCSTLKGANNVLQELYKLQNSKDHQTQVQNYATNLGINFAWIPGYSPVFGGLWESGIKSVKHHLKRTIGENLLTYEEFYTVIVQIEGILNSRPLTPMIASDISDLSYLTPSHFLTGAQMLSFPEPDITSIPTNRLTFWKKCVQIQQSFWKQWHKQYLVQLQNRPKWKNSTPNLQIGTLVILRQENVSPLKWPMARIVKVYPGNDGKVRALDLKTKTGYIMRTSVTKVCPLPIDDSN